MFVLRSSFFFAINSTEKGKSNPPSLATLYNKSSQQICCFGATVDDTNNNNNNNSPHLQLETVDVCHPHCLEEWIYQHQASPTIQCPSCGRTASNILDKKAVESDIYYKCLGIDFGGVLVTSAHDNTNNTSNNNTKVTKGTKSNSEDTSFFGTNYLNTPMEEGVIESLQQLVHMFGPDSVYIVSKAGTNISKKTLEWLEHKVMKANIIFISSIKKESRWITLIVSIIKSFFL